MAVNCHVLRSDADGSHGSVDDMTSVRKPDNCNGDETRGLSSIGGASPWNTDTSADIEEGW
jgi:hypothetical protein